MPKVVTANGLATGSVVFLADDGAWVNAIGQARVFEDAGAADEALERAKADVARALVVDPFLAQTGQENDGRPKMTLRDTIRAYGPTIDYKATGRKVA